MIGPLMCRVAMMMRRVENRNVVGDGLHESKEDNWGCSRARFKCRAEQNSRAVLEDL